jgi:hypothetical protein
MSSGRRVVDCEQLDKEFDKLIAKSKLYIKELKAIGKENARITKALKAVALKSKQTEKDMEAITGKYEKLTAEMKELQSRIRPPLCKTDQIQEFHT